MIDIGYYYNYSSETVEYYYRKLKNKAYVFYYEYLYTPSRDNVLLNI